ncbi:hypothetical protein BHM03_00023962 [Ensete ventricosum]|uniref:Uncharacterized protein n=1 Tax=Ensete ventricosum TaxID=4639 RepID=A0A445MGU4_ENSVE|nr:hypothetical protein BHM03_00023962 [Ensete ventricosum]
MCPQSPPLWAGTEPEGGASMGAAPTGASHVRGRLPCRHQPCPWVAAPTGSNPGRGLLRLLATALAAALAAGREENRKGRPKL